MAADLIFPAQHVALEGSRVIWRLHDDAQGEFQVQLGANGIRLLAQGDDGGGKVVWIEAQAPFELEIDTGFTVFIEQVPAGRTRYLLTHLDRTDVRQV